jgi:hypothetical protein
MKKIEVESSVISKKSPDFKKIEKKAVAGLSNVDLINKHTIGEYDKDEDEDGESVV